MTTTRPERIETLAPVAEDVSAFIISGTAQAERIGVIAARGGGGSDGKSMITATCSDTVDLTITARIGGKFAAGHVGRSGEYAL